MRELFERLKAEGEAGLAQLVSAQTPEGLQLDFKRKENPGRGNLDTNDRRCLSEALSGFSNSAGGLLIFGVVARKGADQIDCAQELSRITNVRLFYTEVMTAIGQLVQPRLDAVEIHEITSTKADNSGYLMVYAPRSERRPHRSEARNHKAYFKRAGDSFFEMEHYDIADAFSRTGSPTLEIRISHVRHTTTSTHAYYRIRLELHNMSDYIAKFPFIIVENMVGVGSPAEMSFSGLRLVRSDYKSHYVGGSNDIIHPHIYLPVAELVAVYERHGTSIWSVQSQSGRQDAPFFQYTYGCEGMRSVSGSISYGRHEFDLPA